MKKKNKIKLLLWGPVLGGSALWYFVFTETYQKILIPWVLVAGLFILWKKTKNKTNIETKTKKIRRYE